MKMLKLMCGASGAALLWSVPAVAEDKATDRANEPVSANASNMSIAASRREILVSASRDTDLLENEYTGSFTVIDEEELEQRQTRDIADVLRDVPGVAVSSVAGQTQVRLRGTEANQVLLLVDGIEVSDPGSGEFDIGTLQAELGSRVEVLRGPQSALYGNDAIGGVIAYDSGRFDGFGVRLEGGENNTINGAARWGVDDGTLAASLSATVVSTDGEPNARAIAGNGLRDIGRDSYTFSGKLSADVSENFELRATARYVETEGETNDQDFAFGSPTFGLVIDSPGVGFENKAIYALVGGRLETLGGDWTHDVSLQLADVARETFAPFGLTSETESDRFKASYVSAFQINDEGGITFAVDYEQEGFNNVATFDDRKETENVGLVGEYRHSGDRFDFSAAIRHDFNDRFQDTTTFRIGAGYELTETTRVRAAVGTGVKNPTFFELFGFFDGTFVGNPDLEPEESTSWEIGLDQTFANGDAVLSVTYFNAELESEIFTTFSPPTFVATPGNRATESEQQGVEVALAAQIGPQWTLNAAYTYLDADEDGVIEVRRPESIASAALTWTAPRDMASATLVLRHNGDAFDNDFSAGTFPAPLTTLDDYTLVNLNARVEIAEGIDIFARAENLLNEEYEQVFSFVSPGRTVIAGFSAAF
ncbi:TonB-dependent receptor, putative [Erythrobacter sp. NAP1]|uniref:TonB-dependent receptor plug domain-containing protein n=1 Tax=Erythrobacter sp. NAP1 TaxID=237727 RepID=UPI0000686C4C|nr:TonB-dependent receptor [Erythrobacter sp. NAP1]EAQ29315.1 TonB-dependent receptor, putative [Erythrobacter sp. NAP1]